jgi:hypothetical protein
MILSDARMYNSHIVSISHRHRVALVALLLSSNPNGHVEDTSRAIRREETTNREPFDNDFGDYKLRAQVQALGHHHKEVVRWSGSSVSTDWLDLRVSQATSTH